MNCQEVRERLPGLIDGELAPEELAEVEKHIELCEECRAEKHRQEQFTTRVKTSLEDLRPSELFVKGVLDKLGDPEKKKREERAAARRTKISLIAAGAVIVVVLVAAWIHAAVTRDDDYSFAATATGVSGQAWMIVGGKAGDVKTELPRYIAWGAKIQTAPESKAIMNLYGGGELTVHEKSEVQLPGGKAETAVVLRKGALTLAPSEIKRLVVISGKVRIVAEPGTRFQTAVQYGTHLLVKVEKGTVSLRCMKKVAKAGAGETWTVLLDGSEPPEKKSAEPKDKKP